MEYLTTAEVAELKGCSLRYVQQLAQSGKLEHMEKDSAANNRTEYVFPLAALPIFQRLTSIVATDWETHIVL